MRILITNDDGIYSPGIEALARVASTFGEVRIVAPDVEQSSAGQSISSSRPLRYRRTPIGNFDAHRVNGTPADCAALGIYMWKNVDVVLSGINLGPNLGNAIWHSGTLAAARQAALLGCRGIALSTPTPDDSPDFATLEPYVASALKLLLPQHALKLINVNFPPRPRGFRWTSQSVRQYDGRIVPGKDPMGRDHYWFTVVKLEEAMRVTDLWAMRKRYVSMTPLSLDLTDHVALAKLKARSRDGAKPQPVAARSRSRKRTPLRKSR